MNTLPLPSVVSGSEQTLRFFDSYDWQDAGARSLIDIISPVTSEILAKVVRVTKEDVGSIIEHLNTGQQTWGQTSFTDRVNVLVKFSQLLREHAAALRDILVLEIGKPKADAEAEVKRTADLVDMVIAEARALRGEYISADRFPGVTANKKAIVEYVPLGVVTAVAPFNYPINLAVSKLAPALLMGNSVLFKPPTNGTIVGLYMTALFEQAGLPKGTLACITGSGRELGDSLVSHSLIKMVAFTGSSEVGVELARHAGMIPLLFECGGNNAAIICEDADVSRAAKECAVGAFSYAGQRCTGVKYILCDRKISDDFTRMFKEAVDQAVTIGDPREDGTKLVGPVISQSAADELWQRIEQAKSLPDVGVHTIGERHGTYLPVTILMNVPADAEIVRKEAFGPVVSIIPVDNIDEAVRVVSGSSYGLQTSIFSRDIARGMQVAHQLPVGTVQLNGSPQRGPDHFPFMGTRDSGVGVQGIKYSLHAMSRLQSTVINFH